MKNSNLNNCEIFKYPFLQFLNYNKYYLKLFEDKSLSLRNVAKI